MRRSALIWLVLRVAAESVRQPLGLGPPSAFALVAATSLLVYLDARLMRERIFHANLGLATPWVALVACSVAGCLEIAVQLLTGVGAH